MFTVLLRYAPLTHAATPPFPSAANLRPSNTVLKASFVVSFAASGSTESRQADGRLHDSARDWRSRPPLPAQGPDRGSEIDRLQSVRRALGLLEALAVRPGGATPKELSQALELHLSTCYRLLNTLVAGGYALRSTSDGLFRLGPRVAYLHHHYLAANQPPAAVVPFVHALQLATGETTMLTQLEGDDIVATQIVKGS